MKAKLSRSALRTSQRRGWLPGSRFRSGSAWRGSWRSSRSYNLLNRERYEGDLSSLCKAEGIACIPYAGLAQGFLTGKYRSGQELPRSGRSEDALLHLDARGTAVLEALDDVAAAHKTTVAAVALAWLRMRPTVIAPVASARTREQLAELAPMVDLVLSDDEVERLDDASSERTAVVSHEEPDR